MSSKNLKANRQEVRKLLLQLEDEFLKLDNYIDPMPNGISLEVDKVKENSWEIYNSAVRMVLSAIDEWGYAWERNRKETNEDKLAKKRWIFWGIIQYGYDKEKLKGAPFNGKRLPVSRFHEKGRRLKLDNSINLLLFLLDISPKAFKLELFNREWFSKLVEAFGLRIKDYPDIDNKLLTVYPLGSSQKVALGTQTRFIKHIQTKIETMLENSNEINFLLVTGEPGTGKTLLVNEALEELIKDKVTLSPSDLSIIDATKLNHFMNARKNPYTDPQKLDHMISNTIR